MASGLVTIILDHRDTPTYYTPSGNLKNGHFTMASNQALVLPDSPTAAATYLRKLMECCESALRAIDTTNPADTNPE